MSQAITHFAIGAGITGVVVTYLIPKVIFPRTIVLLGGVWGMLPDAVKLYDAQLFRTLHGSGWTDVFWFHYSLDHIDSGDSTVWATLAVTLLIGLTFLFEERDYRALGTIRKALGLPKWPSDVDR